LEQYRLRGRLPDGSTSEAGSVRVLVDDSVKTLPVPLVVTAA
jgi:hypothetical protein